MAVFVFAHNIPAHRVQPDATMRQFDNATDWEAGHRVGVSRGQIIVPDPVATRFWHLIVDQQGIVLEKPSASGRPPALEKAGTD